MSEEKFGNAFSRLLDYLQLIHKTHITQWGNRFDCVKGVITDYFSSGDKYFGYYVFQTYENPSDKTTSTVAKSFLIALPDNPSDNLTFAYLEGLEETPRFIMEFPNDPKKLVTLTVLTNPILDTMQLISVLNYGRMFSDDFALYIQKPPFINWLGTGQKFRVQYFSY